MIFSYSEIKKNTYDPLVHAAACVSTEPAGQIIAGRLSYEFSV